MFVKTDYETDGSSAALLVTRHMVAARRIRAGETVMEDTPLTFGPLSSSGGKTTDDTFYPLPMTYLSSPVSPMCVGCYRRLPDPVTSAPRCEACGWPVCRPECALQPAHRDAECALFSERGLRPPVDTFATGGGPELAYQCVSPIRALLLRAADPDKFARVWGLMSHNQARRRQQYWVERHAAVIRYIRTTLGLTQFSEEDIDTVLGIFLVNDFEINAHIGDEEFSSAGGNACVRGLYQIASIPNHDCVANTTHTFASLEEGFRMRVTAARDIAAGEEITHSYVEAQEPFLTRQELLAMGKFFTCACARCSSATELGTYSSALLCPAPGCRAPVITAEPADTRSDWRCTAAGCGKLFPVAKVSNVTGAIKAQAERLEYSEQRAEECGVAAHEAFLKKYGSVLHPNHVILIRAKYSLAKMYGRMAGYEAASLGPDLLDRKRQLCEEVLGVLDTLMPGQVSSHWPPWSRDPRAHS